jgi:hypothetical protein
MHRWAWGKINAITRVWFESFLAVEIGIHLKDFVDWKLFISATVAAVIPVALRWLNPRDSFPEEK